MTRYFMKFTPLFAAEVQMMTPPRHQPRRSGRIRSSFRYLSRIEKSIKDNGFTVRRATEEDLKRMLGVYFEQNVTTERYEDHDGERWVLFGE